MDEREIRRKKRAINEAISAANDVFAFEEMECFGEKVDVRYELIEMVDSLGISRDIAAYIQHSANLFGDKVDKAFAEQCKAVLEKNIHDHESEEEMMQSIDISVFGESSLLGPLYFDVTPPDKDIICKDCKYKWEDLYIESIDQTMEQYTKAFCYKYTEPDGKPGEILFNHADCKFYVPEG